MTKLQLLADLGQSVWYDYIQRSLLESSDFQQLIENGLRGVTSNPAIFKNAIAGSADYDQAMRSMRTATDVDTLYEALVLEDISRAADLFLPVFRATNGLDGYVSIEVNPLLAYDTQETIKEAVRLYHHLERPNIMIKVPSTSEGIPAVRELIRRGVNVNVTLIFGLDQYLDVVNAYIDGLEQLLVQKDDVSAVASVASFFVSRVDTAVDKLVGDKAVDLLGKIAVANSKVAFNESLKIYDSARWKKLEQAGARVQRLLWASTGTKNPSYSDTLYIDSLIGPNTVNTMPPATLAAFLDHGKIVRTLDADVNEAYQHLDMLKKYAIDLSAVTRSLLVDGVNQFKDAYLALLKAIEAKAADLK